MMGRFARQGMFALGAAGMVALGVTVAGSGAAGATSWSVVPSPNVAGSNYNELDATLLTSPSQAWAVGFSRVEFARPGSTYTTLILQH
jgi:hypothetical protein